MEQWYKDGIVFNSQTAIRNDNKGSSLPHFLSAEVIESLGYVKVAEGLKPEPTVVQYVVENVVALVDGVPTKTYSLVDVFADTAEILAEDGVTVITPAKTKLEYETEYLAKLQADAMAKVVQHFTDVTTNYIEGKVQEYNVTNGLAFKDIDAFTKYAINPLSVHHTIANKFVDYADRVWTTVRSYQATATAFPTDAEFKAILDAVTF